MPINYQTGEVVMSFDDLKALAVTYQYCKLQILPYLLDEQHASMERGLRVMREIWKEEKSKSLVGYYSDDPIRWLNT